MSQAQELTLAPVQEPPRSRVSAMAILAGRLQADPEKLLTTLKNTVWKGATTEELLALTIVANEYRLNPLLKEIYAYPAKGGGGGITPIVSIDGWLRIINEHPQMDGMETEHQMDAGGKLVSCTCRIWRRDRSKPVVVTEYLAECKRSTDPWKMEHRMLRHKSIIQCARIAFGFSGLHDEDEGQIIQERDATPRAKVLPPPHMRDLPPPDPEPDQQGDVGNGDEWDGERGDEGGAQ